MTEPALGSPEAPADDERVVFWRYLVLVQAGYPRALARQLALEDVDLKRASSLLAEGCPPPLAARILL